MPALPRRSGETFCVIAGHNRHGTAITAPGRAGRDGRLVAVEVRRRPRGGGAERDIAGQGAGCRSPGVVSRGAPERDRRFGTDPATSALDLNCKMHDLDNLYVVDSSFFLSSTAVNPALAIIANALRVADRIAS